MSVEKTSFWNDFLVIMAAEIVEKNAHKTGEIIDIFEPQRSSNVVRRFSLSVVA